MRNALRRRVEELLEVDADELPITRVVGGVPSGRSGEFQIGDPHELARQVAWLTGCLVDGATFTSAKDIAKQAVAGDRCVSALEQGPQPKDNENYWEITLAQEDRNDVRRSLNLLSDVALFAAAAGAAERWSVVLGAVVRTRNLRARGADDPLVHAPMPPRFGLVPAQRKRGRHSEIVKDKRGREQPAPGGPHQRMSALLCAAEDAGRTVLFNPGSATLQPSHEDERLTDSGQCERPLSVKAPADYLAGHVAQVLHRLDRAFADPVPVVFRAPTRGDLDETQFRYETVGELRRLTPTILDQADWADALNSRFEERDSWVDPRRTQPARRRVIAVQVDEAVAGVPEGMQLHRSMEYETASRRRLVRRQDIINLALDHVGPRSEASVYAPDGWHHPTMKVYRLHGRFMRRQAPRGPHLFGFVVGADPAPRLVAVLDDPSRWPHSQAHGFLDALRIAFADRDVEAQLGGCFLSEGPPTPSDPQRRGVLGKGGAEPPVRENMARLNSAFSTVLHRGNAPTAETIQEVPSEAPDAVP